ncbi:precorrin-6y C5,15-methyltransferase (decarboxylating) subunit CbiE [Pseudoramibacter faecis]|uniref:precorrin-6y C5,15-methyltransferase (decarboxylating) subunit CbiE n=1 Tax=Pseudoramibacter faecis TaxID=3108534 RepID=UPI002E764FC0|nr:precorrin-6y C5,15-methyltransferase (decarboxylating) subunit CbiE [Pseudoramibacter sp. HA2172]
MYKIKVVSLGPGHPDYILPVAKRAIAEAEVICCGRRHLESFDAMGKTVHIIGSGGEKLTTVMAKAAAVYPTQKTALVVSGDCGFYSLLSYARKVIGPAHVEALPGISSLQYLFAKISRPWQDARLMSLHGRDQDLIGALEAAGTVGVLTDDTHNTAAIARELLDHDFGGKVLYTGENLSYPEERITRLTVEEALTFRERGMSVVIITDE